MFITYLPSHNQIKSNLLSCYNDMNEALHGELALSYEFGFSLFYSLFLISLWVCVDDGWFNQPQLAESDWTLGLGGAAQLLHIE